MWGGESNGGVRRISNLIDVAEKAGVRRLKPIPACNRVSVAVYRGRISAVSRNPAQCRRRLTDTSPLVLWGND